MLETNYRLVQHPLSLNLLQEVFVEDAAIQAERRIVLSARSKSQGQRLIIGLKIILIQAWCLEERSEELGSIVNRPHPAGLVSQSSCFNYLDTGKRQEFKFFSQIILQ